MAIVTPIETVNSAAGGVIPTSVASNPLGGFEAFIDNTLNLFTNNAEQRQKIRAANQKQLAEDAERAAKNAAARASVDFFGGLASGEEESIADPAVAEAAQDVVRDYKKLESASKQGRLSMSALNVKAEQAYRNLLRRFPGQEYEIVKALRENGMETPLTYEFKQIESRDAAVNQARNQGVQLFMNKAIENGFSPDSPLPNLINAGRRIVEKEAELNYQKQLMELQKEQRAATKEQREELEAEASKSRWRSYQLTLHNGLDQAMQTFESWIAQKPAGQDGDAFLAQLAPQFELMINNWERNAIREAVESGGDQDLIDQIREDIAVRKEQIKAMISGSFSELEMSTRAVKLLENNLKLNSMQAMPLFHSLRAAVGDTATANFILENAVLKDPEMVKKLTAEAQGIADRDGPMAATKHLEQRMALLMGETTIKDLPREQAVKELPNLIRTHQGLTDAALAGDNPAAAQVATNSLMNIALEALDLQATDGVRPITSAANVLTNPKTVQLMTEQARQGNARGALAMGQYRASTQATLQKLIDAKTPEEANANSYYSTSFNNKSGRWELKFNREKWAKDQETANRSGRFAGMNISNAPTRPSDELVNKIAALNQSIDAMVDTDQFDPDNPLKNASLLERRNFYGSGGRVIPESMRQQGLDGKTNEQRQKVMSWQEQGTALLQEFGTYNSQPYRNMQFGMGALSEGEIESEFEGNANVPLAKSAANTHGVPTSIALNLFRTESRFDPNAKNKSGATGLGQVMPSTAKLYADYMQQNYGTTKLNELTPAQNADLSMKILSDNYRRLGSWPDALSAYHSGKPLNELTERNHDGNMHTSEYVRNILG